LEEVERMNRVVDVLSTKPNHLKIYLNKAEEVLPQITEFFLKMRIPIKSVQMSEPTLDDVFAHYTGLTIEEAEKR